MKVFADDLKQVGANTFRMTLYGNGTIQEAKTAGYFSEGYFEKKKLAQGSAYVNTKTLDVLLYDEENDKWGSET